MWQQIFVQIIKQTHQCLMTLFARFSEAYEVRTCSRSVQGEIIGQIHAHGWENE